MDVVLVIGYPGAGKSTFVEPYLAKGYRRLNRDLAGGTLADLLPALDAALTARDAPGVVLDNTYASAAARAPVVALAKRHGAPVRCVWLRTSIEEAQVNVVAQMIARHGRLLSPDEMRAASKKDPNMFPPGVLFRYRKEFEPPRPEEGFAELRPEPFARRVDPSYTQAAVLLDFDGTLRCTRSGEVYPRAPEDIVLMPRRREVLERYVRDGYKLLGVSNQGDVARGKLTADDATRCFEHTVSLLGLPVEFAFCPHDPAPIQCYCRKPMPGMGVYFIEKHKLDRAKTVMVGDMTTDKTFAARLGVRYVDQAQFFA